VGGVSDKKRLKLSSNTDECKPLVGGALEADLAVIQNARLRASAQKKAVTFGTVPPMVEEEDQDGYTVTRYGGTIRYKRTAGARLVHLSAQLEPCLTPETALHTP